MALVDGDDAWPYVWSNSRPCGPRAYGKLWEDDSWIVTRFEVVQGYFGCPVCGETREYVLWDMYVLVVALPDLLDWQLKPD